MVFMPKYLIQARYTTEGIKGLVADSGSGRRADVQAAVKSLGGTVEVFYYVFGEDDAVVIVDLPNKPAVVQHVNVGEGGRAVVAGSVNHHADPPSK